MEHITREDKDSQKGNQSALQKLSYLDKLNKMDR